MNADSERKFVIFGIFLVVGLIFLMRLFYIQVIDDHFKLSANNNVLRYETEYAARGLVYDRKGKLMVYNEAVYDLMIIPKQAKSIDTVSLCKILGFTREDYIKRFEKAKSYSSVKPSLFEKQLSAETYATLQEKMFRFPGFFAQPRTLRKYPTLSAAHVLGYVGEVDDRIMAKKPYYRQGDYIGVSGIEAAYEEQLRGVRGMHIMLVDVLNRPKGRFQDGMYDTLAIAGKDLDCSLDADLQAYGEYLMQGKSGGIVAIEPSTGEILALVTAPTYDPNLLVGRVRSLNYRTLLQDTTKPLFNRAIQAYYPPGSTFKIINGLIAKNEHVLTSDTRYPCARGWPPGHGKPGCEVRSKHFHPTPLDFIGSVQYSCNSYYSYVFRSIIENNKYRKSEDAFEAWRKYVLSFGIGKKFGSDLPHELAGNVPTTKYYNKYFGKGSWNAYTIISLGIGQGELGCTPLHMANVMAIVANRGYYYTPHIIRSIRDSAAGKELKARFGIKNNTLVDASYFESTVEAMAKVVESGTARESKIPGIEMCGKTGTAQNPHGKDHSVFMAFAPRINPKIAIAVLVENGGWGAAWAAPIASLMIEKYLNDKIARPEMEKRMIEMKNFGVQN